MNLIAMLVLIGAVGAIIVYPLIRRSEDDSGKQPAPPDVAARKRLALAAIKELEFDHATGKIDDNDYRVLRARYDARAVETLDRSRSPRPPEPPLDDGAAQLEAEIRAARGRRFCRTCGGPLPKAARFCPACGTNVEVPA